METHVNTPQVIFNLPQRLLVPLFQRPYVWDEERQWRPLWLDVERIADKVLALDHDAKHFLGAVVLQQEPNSTGTLITRTIIDGQQRLTTLQLLFDAIYEEIHRIELGAIARRLGDLVENSEHQRREPEDRYKVWPTNRDRDAFAEVMGTPQPSYTTLSHKTSRLVKAHEYFARQARDWLSRDSDDLGNRASALVDAVATRLQLVVIDLKAEEDAQEIFETLNARGTPLTAADLIKNLIFQRLNASPEESEKAYHEYWQQFETPFWEQEVSAGRILSSRSSLFLTQWLIAQTQEDIPAREVFASFKRRLDDSDESIMDTLRHIKACADVYEGLQEKAADRHTPLGPIPTFVYRIGELQSEVVRPILIWLTDPTLPEVPPREVQTALTALESWLVRRTLVRERAAGHNRFLLDVLQQLVTGDRETAGSRLESLLAEQTSDVAYWPDDEAVRASLTDMPIYRRISRGRLRMILEAIEDRRRGFTRDSDAAKGEQPVVRQECTIEHVLPQRWGQHWPLPENVTPAERDMLIQTLGNLTLVSRALNPSMSNAAWQGERGKRSALLNYSSIKLTSDVIQRADSEDNEWTEELIEERTQALVEEILAIWPVPSGHTNADRRATTETSAITIRDLVKAEILRPGDVLIGARLPNRKFRARITQDAQIEFDGVLHETPSGAGRSAKGRNVNGWAFWRVGDETGPLLRDLRAQLAPIEEEAAIGPFSAEDIDEWWTGENPGLEALALAVTEALPTAGRVMPSQRDKGDFAVGRYWAHAADQPNICVGIPKSPPLGSTETPLWARYRTTTSGFDGARSRLLEMRDDVLIDNGTGSLWIPLPVPADTPGPEMVAALAALVSLIDSQARGET